MGRNLHPKRTTVFVGFCRSFGIISLITHNSKGESNLSNQNTKSETLLKPQDVAERSGVSVTTLATWRCTKRYPLAYVKVGRLVRYRMGDVEAFEVERLREVIANDW